MSGQIEQQTNRKNLLQLVHLRAIAIWGQFATIFTVHYGMDIALPLEKMFLVLAFLLGLNIVSWQRYKYQKNIRATELFVELLLDAAALTVQLYLSGGASNPFVSLFLLQVIIGAVLLRPVFAWGMAGVTFVCYLTLTLYAHDLPAMHGHHHTHTFFNLHIQGMLVSYTLAACLLVFFLTRINANLRERDTLLADIKQQSMEEEHVLRLGLLAAGAAHELGTPLTTLSVILKDWQSLSLPEDRSILDEDIKVMQREIDRCKGIVSGILLSSGHMRGEAAEVSSLNSFVRETVAQWQTARQPAALDYHGMLPETPIVADKVIHQILFNVFDNAYDASPDWVSIDAYLRDSMLVIRVEDRGKGFTPDSLASFGKPYASSKDGHGRGLGLFLVVNTLRKLGGQAAPENTDQGGCVTLSIPLQAISKEIV